ncbi:hypothetical protein [Brevundimonas sp.]|jgi:hypothetical protein|uniref:hypothetical protein n=1 Tax=Brevundimonas sp. TaxID=1871086 RepID=UPI002E13B151|nr:hypothetical protein [Brevundimonas sp.]
MIAAMTLAAALASPAPPQAPDPVLVAVVRGVEACFARQFPVFMPDGYDEAAFLTEHGFRPVDLETGSRFWYWGDASRGVGFETFDGCAVLVSRSTLTEAQLVASLDDWGRQVGFAKVEQEPGYALFELRTTGPTPSACSDDGKARGGSRHEIELTTEQGIWALDFYKGVWCE